MTKENKARLVELYLEDNRKRYPSFPEHARPIIKYTENGSNALTKCVIAWINFSGGQAERISTTGRPIDKTQTSTDVIGRQRTIGSIEWIPGTGTKGSADISATINGRSIKIEIKYGKDTQGDDQKKYEQDITKAGGVYLIVRNMDSFIDWHDDFIGELLTSPSGRKYQLLARARIPGGDAYCDRIRFKDDGSYLHVFYDKNGKVYDKSDKPPEFMFKDN